MVLLVYYYTTGAGKRQISFKFTSKLAAKFTGKLAVTSILLAIEHAILHQALLGTYKFKNQKSLFAGKFAGRESFCWQNA